MINKISITILSLLFLQAATVAQITMSSDIKIENGCDIYLKAYKIGTTYEQTHYDKNGKIARVAECLVTDLKSDAKGWEMSFKIVNRDKKSKELNTTDVKCSCKDGTLSMGTNNLFSNAFPQDMKLESNVSGTGPSYSNIEVGKPQADSEIEISASMEGFKLMKVTSKTSQRNVVAKETITTSAGTFNCFKITSYSEVKILFLSKLNITEYWSNDYGLVKMEMYDMKGKLQGSIELTKFKE